MSVTFMKRMDDPRVSSFILLIVLTGCQVSVKEVHTPDARTIPLNAERNPKGFVNNEIHTAKFGIVNFLPIFLFIMFRRVAYLYFLAQVRYQV